VKIIKENDMKDAKGAVNIQDIIRAIDIGRPDNVGKKRSEVFRGRYIKSCDELYPMYDSAFSEFQGMGVLDVGCHMGFYSLFLSNYATSVIGLDINAALISEAEDILRRVAGADNVEFMAASVRDLNAEFFRDNAIEGVFIHKSLGHFSKDERLLMTAIFIEGGVRRIVTNVNPHAEDSLITKQVREDFGNFKWKKFAPLLLCIDLVEIDK